MHCDFIVESIKCNNGVYFFLNQILTKVSTLMENDGILLGEYYTSNLSVWLLFLECLTLKM
jgi:hypothetical protein